MPNRSLLLLGTCSALVLGGPPGRAAEADALAITANIQARRRLGLPPRSDDKPSMAVGIELRGESYGLLIDTVGEVMKLGEATLEPNPVNLDARLARVSGGVHRLDGQLMVILDVDYVLNTAAEPLAA